MRRCGGWKAPLGYGNSIDPQRSPGQQTVCARRLIPGCTPISATAPTRRLPQRPSPSAPSPRRSVRCCPMRWPRSIGNIRSNWSASSRASQYIWSIWLMLARSTWPSSSGRRFRCRATAGPRSRGSLSPDRAARYAGDDWTELLASQPFIPLRPSLVWRSSGSIAPPASHGAQICREVDELDAIVKLVAQRAGVALIPQTSAYRHWPAGVRAIDLGAQTFHRDVGLVHRQDAVLSAAQQGLAERIVAAASDLGTDHADAARR